MTILCYHSVESGWRSPLAVSPDTFERHCAWLSRRRRVVDLHEAVSYLDASGRLPRGMTALTFDDGFAALHQHAFPLLRQYKLPATVFLVAETLTPQGREVDWVDPPPVWPPSTLSRDQVREMQAAGIRFGSHSYAHRDLTAMGDRACEDDLRASRDFLGDLLGYSVDHLAYPRGRHSQRVRRAAQRAGYTHAFTLPESPGPPGPYAIPRAGVYPANGVPSLRAKSSRWYLPLRTSPVFPAVRLAVRGRRHSGDPANV